VGAAVYVLNRQRDDDKIAFEAWFGFKPNVAHLRPFSCDVYLLISDDKKFDVKSRRVTFVDYSETEKNFRVFNRDRHKVLVSCNIKFNETETTPIAE